VDRWKPDPAGRENSQNVHVSEERDVAPGGLGTRDEAPGPFGDLIPSRRDARARCAASRPCGRSSCGFYAVRARGRRQEYGRRV